MSTSKGLSLSVVYTSSEDENYPASELTRAHSNAGNAPSKRGWQSAKLCEYPQELGFRFEGEVELAQLQILAHQSKTPTKVEVFVASYDGTGDVPPYHRAEFHKLGYLTFHNNEHNKYRSRERKTVQLKQDACYLKLVLHRCHINPLNLYNQVSVMQVLAFGDVLLPFPASAFAGQTASGPSSLPPVRRPGAGAPQSRAVDPDADEDVYHMLGGGGGRDDPRRAEIPQQQQDPYYGVVPSPTMANAPQRNPSVPRKVILPPANAPQQHHIYQQEYQTQSAPQPVQQQPMLQPAFAAAPPGTMNGLAYYRSQSILDFERFYIERSKELTTKKAIAVENEDFDVAKACKEQLSFLQTNAETIYDLEATKIRNIFDEDFDACKRAKLQMDKLITHTIQVLTAAKAGKPLKPISIGSTGDGDTTGGGGYAAAPSAPADKRGHHRRRSSANELEDIPVDNRPPPADVKNFDEQPVTSKYAQKMAEEAKRRQPAREEDEDHQQHNSHNGRRQHDEDDDADEEEPEAEEEEADEPDDEAEEDEDEEPKKQATPPPAPRKDSNRTRHRSHSKHEHREPDADDHPHDDTQEDEAANARMQEESAVAPASGLRFELETFEEWERDVYFAIQDEASRDGTSEPPAEPLETTEGMTDFYSAFGHYTTACLFSRRWKLRDAAIRVVTQFLAVYFKHIITANAVKAMLKYLDQKGYGLLDTIQAVYLASCEFIVRLVEGRIQDADLSTVQIHVQALLPRLFFRAADTNARSREEAITVIFLLANSAIGADKVAAAALAETVDQDKRRVPQQNHRAFLSRLMVMQQLLSGHGLGKSISVDAIMTKLLLPCLNHQNSEVRDLAVVVAGCIDSAKGQEVMRYLPQVRNPATRTVIEEKLAFPAEGDEAGPASAEPSPEKAKPVRSHSAKKRGEPKAKPAAQQPAAA